MSRSSKLVLATALALVASGVAVADDGSMGRLSDDAYAYFSQPVHSNAMENTVWRRNHPNGTPERDLQAASSSSLAASAFELEYPSAVFASSSLVPSWHQSHPNGLTERELQAASASSLSMSQSNESSLAIAPSRVTSLTRK